MKTPMQELRDSVGYMAQGLTADELYDYFMKKSKMMLDKEKEAMVDFAYKCRNLMAVDEFAISKWYDKTFTDD